MKFTRLKTTAMAGIMAASMVMPGMTAMAADSAQIQKTVTANAGVTTIPSADQDVTFKVTQVGNAGGNVAPSNLFDDASTAQIEDSKTVTISIADVSTTKTFTESILSNTEVSNLKVGEYNFKVEETLEQSTGDFGWVVVNEDKITYNLQVLKDANGNVTYQLSDATDTTKKKDVAEFKNTYNKKSTNPDGSVSTLTVKKSVENSKYVDEDTEYPITIVITAPDEQQSIGNDSYTVADGISRDVDEDAKTVTIKANVKKDGTIVVSNLAVGATYKVTETTTGLADLGWNEKASTTEASGTVVESSANAEIKNVFNSPAETGVVTTIAPYVTLVVLAVAAIAAYAALKRRVAR